MSGGMGGMGGRSAGTVGGCVGDLYPTVGIDAPVSVTMNYGREAFVFDLPRYIAQREEEVMA